MFLIHFLESNPWASNGLQTLVLLATVLAVRRIANYTLNKQEIRSGELRLRWNVQVRNSLFLIFVFGLFVIWGAELKTLALSLVAVAVALILATKELIMCLMGSIFKITSREFSVGDRIIIGDFRGEVIDQTLLSTTLIEVGPGKHMHQQTGRAITLPNSMFVTMPLLNESFTNSYVLHSFSIPITLTQDWRLAEQCLLVAAQQVCAPYREEAEALLTSVARKKNVEVPNVSPRVSLNVNEPDRIVLILRVPVPVRQQGRIEQEIVRSFLDSYFEAKEKNRAVDYTPIENAA